jgi:hypothetical protein
MNTPSIVTLSAILSLASAVPAADLFPFVLPWDDASPGITNLEKHLHRPAGGKGFVVAHDGHLFAGEERIRFFGVNMAFGGNFPTHADAEKIAARMAKFGINCVRFHHMDTSIAPDGILQKDRRTLDPESLDRLDYFVAELKKKGIYTNLNLHVGNRYPGMPKWEGAPSYFKGVDNFYPPMIEQQRDFARALLTHVNPYTKTSYANEPAVAFIEINNENGFVMEWNNGSFDDMPDPYAAELRRQWNEWLRKKYGTDAKLRETWNQGVEPLGEELVNSNLNQWQEHWFLEQNGGAKAEARNSQIDARENSLPGRFANATNAQAGTISALQLNVTKPGGESWHVQFSQSPLKLEEGKTYTVSFLAKADKSRKLSVNLSQAHEPWKVLAGSTVQLSTAWQQFRFALTVNASDDKARLSFSNLGLEAGDTFFADISLRRGGIGSLREGEALGSVDFFRKKDVGQRTAVAQRDWHRFIFDTEVTYWPEMSRFIKNDLKARGLVLGTASGFSPWPVQAMLDVVDAHAYWQHPHFPRRQWDMGDWTVDNESMAGKPDGGAIPAVATRRVAGKPFIVTEYNHAAPNTYSSEAFLELCAIAALQDWDGVFAFAYSHRRDNWDTKHATSFFDIDQHPTKMATLPAAISLFYRADIQPPVKSTIAQVTMESAIDSIRRGSSWVDARAYGVRTEEIFQRPIAVRLGPEDKRASSPAPNSPVIRSDNGQLTWDTSARRMLISSPRSTGVVGNVRAGETIDLGDVSIVPGTTAQNWATINLTLMEGADLKSAKRILITATGLTENTDMRWKDDKKTSVGKDWGKSPSLVEGIAAKISLPSLANAKAWALDGLGQRKTEVPLEQSNGRTQIELSPAQQTLWWEIEVK